MKPLIKLLKPHSADWVPEGFVAVGYSASDGSLIMLNKDEDMAGWVKLPDGRYDASVVSLEDMSIRGKLLISFREVKYSFNVAYNFLTTLEGCPEEVGLHFRCSGNKISDMVGAPKRVGGDFYVSFNRSLDSLEGCPEEVGGNFYVGSTGGDFTEEDIRSRCRVGGQVIGLDK